MLNKISVLFLLGWLLAFASFAKTLEQDVYASKSEVSAEMNALDLLTLNGLHLIITSELVAQKLEPKLFWDKMAEKKLTPKEELAALKVYFSDAQVSMAVPSEDAKEEEKSNTALRGTLKVQFEPDQLKLGYEQLVNNLEDTKQKTFYLLADFSLDSSMTVDDLGVAKSENFNGAIIDSWIKLIQKDFKTYEVVKVLEKDFSSRPDFMNAQSVTLKWNSTFRKSSVDDQKKIASYELSAQFVLVNTKSGSVITSFDFPVQKRELSTINKKALSSSLASLVYNLLYSQSQKIQEVLAAQGAAERAQLELKVMGVGLSEVYALNGLIQEKLKDFKATSTLKNYSSNGTLILLEAQAGVEQILDKLASEGGKFPLNEQKILIFNRADKSFAFIPKDSNN